MSKKENVLKANAFPVNASIVYAGAGFVASKSTGNQANDYTFEVNDLEADVHYFRLKQIDYDGTPTYSVIRSVKIEQPLKVTVSPNPVKNELMVTVFQDKKAPLSISLVNALGQVITLLSPRETEVGQTTWRFDISKYPAGVYHCICSSTDGLQNSVKIVKN